MKLIKDKTTNKYSIINDVDFDSAIHIDRTNNVIYWKMNAHLADYCYIRDRITEAVIASGGFSALRSDVEKDICLEYTKSVSDVELIGYLIGKGMTQEEAQFTYLQYRANDIRNAAQCFSDRIDKAEFTVIVMKYLGQDGGTTFLDNCRNFISDLKTSAILGTQYGNTIDGIFDYIEDTGGYLTVPGLSSFFTLPDEQTTLDAMRKELKDLLYYGYTT